MPHSEELDWTRPLSIDTLRDMEAAPLLRFADAFVGTVDLEDVRSVVDRIPRGGVILTHPRFLGSSHFDYNTATKMLPFKGTISLRPRQREKCHSICSRTPRHLSDVKIELASNSLVEMYLFDMIEGRPVPL
ncbi:hypothetical protein DFH08DRAFT_939121 [Mycena albidolilacea]|uniref:Uncharacterized protein n=1 Tax=Mycena albidolilacea TaxID=1033008 RepID=A0AAD7EMS4_9AGAR|nr:hypothetical protein DFH08DRAFT_939121 [Mycena albidolilacea]